jgi:hypothetical protein
MKIKLTKNEARTANTGLAKVAVQCSADTFVVNQCLVLRINICGENRHLRQARNRCVQPLRRIVESNAILKKKCGTKFDRPEK